MIRFNRTVVIIATLFLFSSCATTGEQPTAVLPEKLDLILKANPAMPHYRATGKVAVAIPGGSTMSLRTALLASSGNRFRLTLYAPIGGAWMLATADGETFTYTVPSEKIHNTRLQNNAFLKVGSLQVYADDFARFIIPTIDMGWLSHSKIFAVKNGVRVKKDTDLFDFRFDDKHIIQTVNIWRNGANPVTFRYIRDIPGELRVDIGNSVVFKFLQIEAIQRPETKTFLHTPF